MSKTRHTPNLDSIDNIEMQAGQFRELSAEELEICAKGGADHFKPIVTQ
jgi:hypothetical protein